MPQASQLHKEGWEETWQERVWGARDTHEQYIYPFRSSMVVIAGGIQPCVCLIESMCNTNG